MFASNRLGLSPVGLLRDCALFRLVLSRITLATSFNAIRFLFAVEVIFGACLLLALADIILLNQRQTLIIVFALFNFAAIDTAIGLMLILLLKKEFNSIDVIEL